MNISKELFQFDLSFIEYYLFSFLFVCGNLLFPWVVHKLPLGGPRFLPIYFFVLIGAYKFGWKVGLLTAILSPLANTLLTGMPSLMMLPTVFVKGIALALIAAFISKKTNKLSFTNLAIVIIGYQTIGVIFESIYLGNLQNAISSVIISYPGLLIQLALGYLILFFIKDYGKLSIPE